MKKIGLPLIAKPDNGVGAAATFKIETPEDVDHFKAEWDGHTEYFFEKFVTSSEICTFDGLVDRGEEVVGDDPHVAPHLRQPGLGAGAARAFEVGELHECHRRAGHVSEPVRVGPDEHRGCHGRLRRAGRRRRGWGAPWGQGEEDGEVGEAEEDGGDRGGDRPQGRHPSPR